MRDLFQLSCLFVQWSCLFVVTSAVVACGAEDDELCDHSLCDIRDPACVARTAEVVACQRGVEVAIPEVRYIDAATLLAEIEAAEAEDPLTPEEQQDLVDSIRVDALFGLMPSDYEPDELTADQLANVAALYQADTKAITILTDKVHGDPEYEYSVLVHELVHFFQDRERGLRSLHEQHATTMTRALGLRAVIEGEAELFQDLAYLELDGLGVNDVSWSGYLAERQQDRLERAAESETPFVDVWGLFPYAWGEELMLDAYLSGPERDIDAVYERPPVSLRQAMAGHAAWPAGLPNEDAILLPVAIPVLPPEYVPFYATHASVWLVNASLQRTGQGGLWSNVVDSTSAELLSGFRHEPTGAVVGFWRLRTTQAGTLNDAFLSGIWEAWIAEPAGPAQHITLAEDGDVVLIAASEELDVYEVRAAILGWQSPEEALPEEALPETEDAAHRRWGPGRDRFEPRRR